MAWLCSLQLELVCHAKHTGPEHAMHGHLDSEAKYGLAGFANGDGAVAGFQRDLGTAGDSARNLSNQVFSGLGGAG